MGPVIQVYLFCSVTVIVVVAVSSDLGNLNKSGNLVGRGKVMEEAGDFL